LLGLQPEYAEAFKLALPGLASARIVDDTAQAIELSRQSSSNSNGHGNATVTIARTGERVIAGRLVTGGSGAEKGTGVLALKREIVELQERWHALTEQVADAEAELRTLAQLISASSEQRNQLDAELRQLENRLAVEREQVQQA
jgi:chromosome segregation ATPase